jgi:hypothetical protein
MSDNTPKTPEWMGSDGLNVSCTEKIKVLNENYDEIQEIAAEAFEDAVLMGCDPAAYRRAMIAMIEGLEEPYSD